MDRMVIELGPTMKYQLDYKNQYAAADQAFAGDKGDARLGTSNNSKTKSAIRMAELNADDSDKLTLKTSPGLGSKTTATVDPNRSLLGEAFNKLYLNQKLMLKEREENYKKQLGPDVDDSSIPVPQEMLNSKAQNFISFLESSESSGDPRAESIMADGRKHAGLLQFSEKRLTDARKALDLTFTMEEFKNDTELQRRVGAWHIKDIDTAIKNLSAGGGLPEGFDNKNGLRAVAHLGGISGMIQFVTTRGEYDKHDGTKKKPGTYMSEYYKKFSAIK
jgi:hypothetical protein